MTCGQSRRYLNHFSIAQAECQQSAALSTLGEQLLDHPGRVSNQFGTNLPEHSRLCRLLVAFRGMQLEPDQIPAIDGAMMSLELCHKILGQPVSLALWPRCLCHLSPKPSNQSPLMRPTRLRTHCQSGPIRHQRPAQPALPFRAPDLTVARKPPAQTGRSCCLLEKSLPPRRSYHSWKSSCLISGQRTSSVVRWQPL